MYYWASMNELHWNITIKTQYHLLIAYYYCFGIHLLSFYYMFFEFVLFIIYYKYVNLFWTPFIWFKSQECTMPTGNTLSNIITLNKSLPNSLFSTV